MGAKIVNRYIKLIVFIVLLMISKIDKMNIAIDS